MLTSEQIAARNELTEKWRVTYAKAICDAGLRYSRLDVYNHENTSIHMHVYPIGAEIPDGVECDHIFNECDFDWLALYPDTLERTSEVVDIIRRDWKWPRLGLQAGQRVKLRDNKAFQEYRARYWKRKRQLPPHMPNLDATYLVNHVWVELYKGEGTFVASIIQVEPLAGAGLAFVMPQDDLVKIEIAEPAE